MNTIQARDARGFTLIEMVISILIYGIVLAAGIGFVATQNRMFHQGMDGMSSLQALRFSIGRLETDIPTLGTNLPGSQPAIVHADKDLLAFTGDYISNVANDPFATFIDIGAATGEVIVPSSAVTLGNTSYQWPDSAYLTTAGTRSPGELIQFWFELDTATARTDDYILYRQHNKTKFREQVAGNILAAANGAPFFRYFKRTDFVSQAATIDSIPANLLPIRHFSAYHGVPSDTGKSALADSIRAVRVSFRVTNGVSAPNEKIAEVSRIIDMPNAGFGVLQTCGDEPILGSTLAGTAADLGGGDWVANLAWNAATDETTGESDVVRYVIYRQQTPIGLDWGDPFLSIPAGSSTYTYQDRTVASGATYQYALAAQDCTPSLSTLAKSNVVIIP